jgi:hypothetical protein
MTSPMTPMTIPRSRRWVAVAAVAALSLAACGDDSPGPTADVDGGGEQEDAQPTPGGTAFTDAEFDEIPIPRGATEAGEQTERDGVVTQSYTVTETSPEQIMDEFVTTLAERGWENVESVRSTGTDSFAAAWVQGDDRLEISALLAQGVEDERTQFSVVLLPDRTPGEVINDAPTTTGG